MDVLAESVGLLGGRTSKDIEMTVKLIAPQPEDPDEVENSRIPKKYHIVRTFPIFPKDYADQGYRCYNKDGLWHVVFWPSSNPDSRQDVQYLSDAVRLMLDELQGDMVARIEPSQLQDVKKAKDNAAHMIQLFEKRISVLRLALDEITRQVSAHCTERGTLLSFIIDDLFGAFNDIPKQYNSALKIMKKEVDQLRVSLDAKNMEMDSQTKDLNEQISLMMLERRMEKEWHAQLEEQVKKWKEQVESYKKKAKEQIKLEKEMLHHQISSLREVVSELRLENDALKEQVQFQRGEMLKSEKKYAEFEQQLQSMNKKNEKLQIQISRVGNQSGRATYRSESNDGKPVKLGIEKNLQDESRLKQLLIEFPEKRPAQPLTQREVTQIVFGLFEQLFNNPASFAPLDDFYAMRLIVTEESPQAAADSGRALLETLNQLMDSSPLAQITMDFMRRKYTDAILRVFVQFFGFFKAQPFQGNMVLDHTTDIPSIPVTLATNLTQAMFTAVIGETAVKEVNHAIKAVQIEERGCEPMISMITMFDLALQKVVEFYNKKCADTLNSFARTFTRFQRTIMGKLPNADASNPRMDWRTFRDFMKPIRPELDVSELERIFFDTTQFSDSVASVTNDSFDTMCVSKQIYINNIKLPGSGKRLRYVPPDMLAVIESAWKSSLRAAVKKAITELSKNEQSQNAVVVLRALDQKLEDTLKNPSAGPLCVQMLHEAASIIANEAVTIASSQPIDRCLTIMERQLAVLNTDSIK